MILKEVQSIDTHVKNEVIEDFIVEYLIKEGYAFTLNELTKNSQKYRDTLCIEERNQLKTLIQGGDIDVALESIRMRFPELLINNFKIDLEFKALKYVDLLSRGDAFAALMYGRSELSPIYEKLKTATMRDEPSSSQDYMDKLERLFTLIAVNDVMEINEVYGILKSNCADSVNSAIVDHLAFSKKEKLETLTKQCIVCVDTLLKEEETKAILLLRAATDC
eukprot:TRINITY_DN2634_c0_g1_i12.p1 TRINITY_DN2634_c0_g1~~TRINITY_DN2634_c0_g1_i12.p1  ORF type:complete len:221 (-),score=33.71 TRINITY_DN2634_c0_g1_i12:62-724(-)